MTQTLPTVEEVAEEVETFLTHDYEHRQMMVHSLIVSGNKKKLEDYCTWLGAVVLSTMSPSGFKDLAYIRDGAYKSYCSETIQTTQ